MQEVNNLLRQYAQMKKMFKQMGKPSFARRMAGNEDAGNVKATACIQRVCPQPTNFCGPATN